MTKVNVLEAAHSAGVKKLCSPHLERYTANQNRCMLAKTPKLPKNLHDAGKAAEEMYCRAYTLTQGIET
jgi:hypothetical protein